jgi:hypothetical protein
MPERISREDPMALYRVHRSNGDGNGRSVYCDSRREAILLAAEIGGKVEAYVYGIGWQSINKVAEASE